MDKMSDYKELRRKLAGLADDEYREFSMKGIPCERPFVGVRIPLIRSVALKVPNEKLTEFLMIEPVTIEEVLLRGMLIARLSYDEMMVLRDVLNGKSWFDSQIDYIDNWCTCDVFCSGLKKQIKTRREELFEKKIESLLEDKREFAARAGLVLLKSYYVDFDYLAVIFDRVDKLASREEYYIRMAIAWLVAECFIKYPDVTLAYMKMSKLPRWTYNKTISKICDSYRVELEMKELLKKMRR